MISVNQFTDNQSGKLYRNCRMATWRPWA